MSFPAALLLAAVLAIPTQLPRVSTVAGPSPNAGVIPVEWSQSAPIRTSAQSISAGSISASAEPARSYTTRIVRRSAPGSTK